MTRIANSVSTANAPTSRVRLGEPLSSVHSDSSGWIALCPAWQAHPDIQKGMSSVPCLAERSAPARVAWSSLGSSSWRFLALQEFTRLLEPKRIKDHRAAAKNSHQLTRLRLRPTSCI